MLALNSTCFHTWFYIHQTYHTAYAIILCRHLFHLCRCMRRWRCPNTIANFIEHELGCFLSKFYLESCSLAIMCQARQLCVAKMEMVSSVHPTDAWVNLNERTPTRRSRALPISRRHSYWLLTFRGFSSLDAFGARTTARYDDDDDVSLYSHPGRHWHVIDAKTII